MGAGVDGAQEGHAWRDAVYYLQLLDLCAGVYQVVKL